MIKAWKAVFDFNRLSEAERQFVFYAEDPQSWNYLGPLVEELTLRLNQSVCYLTSSHEDPILSHKNEKIKAFYIGLGTARTFLFYHLKAQTLTMTMPDLETFHIKRSRRYPVHYIYVFHSLVSTHMIYRKGAFDHFDTILAAGPHHIREIRATENFYHLSPKNLLEMGYPRLDTILKEAEKRKTARIPHSAPTNRLKVVVAPSWGPHGLLENLAIPLIKTLIQEQFQVTVRPHPVTLRKNPEIFSELKELFGTHPDFHLELDTRSQKSLHESDIMISDWSGAALEYAFGLQRPVIFVNVPKKINNPDYKDIGLEPILMTLRDKLGCSIEPETLNQLGPKIRKLCSEPSKIVEKINRLRNDYVFNIGTSARIGAQMIFEVLIEKSDRPIL